MVRVLLVIQRLWQGGGTETHVVSLAEALQRRGHFVGIYTSGGPWVPFVRKKGLTVHTRQSSGFSTRDIAYLRDLVRTYRYEVVHAHDSSSFQLVSKAVVPHKRIVMTVHGFYASPRSIYRCGRKASAVIAVSPSIRSYLQHTCALPSHKVRVIPNGIPTSVFREIRSSDLRSHLQIPPQAFVVGYAARFTFDKVAIGKRIARILTDYAKGGFRQEVFVLIAGRNSKTFIHRKKHIIALGHVAHMERFYRTCDVVIGTGRTAIESLACGTPTIAVGRGAYIGLMDPDKLARAAATNFGDHALKHDWSTQQLIRDLDHARRNQALVRHWTNSVTHAVRQRFDIGILVRQIEGLYDHARSE